MCDDHPVPLTLSGSPASYTVALNRDGMHAATKSFCQYYAKQVLDPSKPFNGFYGPFGDSSATSPGHQNIQNEC